MVESLTAKEAGSVLAGQLMAGAVAGLTVSEATQKARPYELATGLIWYEPLVLTQTFWTAWERPSIDINKEIDEIPIIISEYEDGFTAFPLEIDGVVSQGDNLAEALENVENAISFHLETFGADALAPKSDRAAKVFLAKTLLSKQGSDSAENAA